jgi:hypothetical protein
MTPRLELFPFRYRDPRTGSRLPLVRSHQLSGEIGEAFGLASGIVLLYHRSAALDVAERLAERTQQLAARSRATRSAPRAFAVPRRDRPRSRAGLPAR